MVDEIDPKLKYIPEESVFSNTDFLLLLLVSAPHLHLRLLRSIKPFLQLMCWQ
ncbi:hypothetical protein VCR14J2_390278 [Vibrio coralliirubri]|nr:hypothetical protein VCR14J2_390278 [Vibrio coralliirubri]